MGAQMVREVASKTSDIAGDGTTTATVLAKNIYANGLKHITSGANPVYLQRGINKAVEAAVAALHKMSKKVSDSKEICQVATVSANWDTEIGNIIADAMAKVGKDGTITVEEAKASKPPSMWSKECSSTRAIYLLTWLPIWKQWKLF